MFFNYYKGNMQGLKPSLEQFYNEELKKKIDHFYIKDFKFFHKYNFYYQMNYRYNKSSTLQYSNPLLGKGL